MMVLLKRYAFLGIVCVGMMPEMMAKKRNPFQLYTQDTDEVSEVCYPEQHAEISEAVSPSLPLNNQWHMVESSANRMVLKSGDDIRMVELHPSK
jgi:hypothetical protein